MKARAAHTIRPKPTSGKIRPIERQLVAVVEDFPGQQEEEGRGDQIPEESEDQREEELNAAGGLNASITPVALPMPWSFRMLYFEVLLLGDLATAPEAGCHDADAGTGKEQ